MFNKANVISKMDSETMKVFHSNISRSQESKLKPEFLKVFQSNVTRGNRASDNNLYDLINVVPACPKWEIKERDNTFCDFVPNTNKYYVPKKRNKIKVKTVRDIRMEFEKDVFSYLHNDLEKQQNILLKKITAGSAKDNSTKVLAKNILKSDNPVSRSAWQMLMNVNPEDQPNSIQFVLWNGKRIRVNGSKGGKNKFLCNHDLSTRKTITSNKPIYKKNSSKKIGLLRNSLSVNFKPGPLTKKKALDDSYQKFNVGDSELINLPKPGLEIQPTFGVLLEPTVVNFLNNYRNADGVISEKWAEFSVSVLGSMKNTEISQNCSQPVAFALEYKSNQSRILMRRAIEDVHSNEIEVTNLKSEGKSFEDDFLVIRCIVNDILDAVEISLYQDECYTDIDEPREVSPGDFSSVNTCFSSTKEKPKRKLNELDRLDVTIIRIPEGSEDEKNENCAKSFCSLGCICNSLRCDYKLKQHCGHVDCMFECKCDYTKYKVMNSFDGLLPGLLNLNEEINLKLAKEEQKFHQTVVVTREKSILLKSEKRNWKASKRYSDFFSNMNLRTDMKNEPRLQIVDFKLNCDNVEPWCMVHNLYKCFCKGKFVDTSLSLKSEHINKDALITELENIESDSRNNIRSGGKIETNKLNVDSTRDNAHSNGRDTNKLKLKQCFECEESYDETNICARVEPYQGRKYIESYYKNTNKKILEMERNDSNLHKKMISIVFKTDASSSDSSETNICTTPDPIYKDARNKTNTGVIQVNSVQDKIVNVTLENENIEISENKEPIKKGETQATETSAINCDPKSLLIKNKLMAWVEVGYKQYKQRFKQGNVKLFLEPPRQGKLSLYPSEFIISRYRERKNLFLIKQQQPMRIFMAVDVKNSFFDNCINVNDIQFADLHKYPATIQNLVTYTNDQKNTFFIMCGLTLCWEIIGTVTKVNDNSDEDTIDVNSHKMFNKKNLAGPSSRDKEMVPPPCDNKIQSAAKSPEGLPECNNINNDIVMYNCDENKEIDVADTNSGTSKWFVMTIQNDFSEILFYNRGFFVKYEAIIKAINVARMSNKAVRLSAPKCTDQNSATPFGIYAIPNTKEYCVFIGPYEKNEALGIETVKSFKSAQKSKGVWITTQKIDNTKVIDSPLLFMPPANLHPQKIVPLEKVLTNEPIVENFETVKNLCQQSNAGNTNSKVVKPIKIRKTDGFYHFAPNSLDQLASTSSQIQHQGLTIKSSTANRSLIIPTLVPLSKSNVTPSGSSFQQSLHNENKKPIAEIAPQIKIVGVYSEAESLTQNTKFSKRSEGSMFVLKPEEINKKLMLSQECLMAQRNILPSNSKNSVQPHMSSDSEMNEDIENFLATYEVCIPPNVDVDMIDVEEDSEKSLKFKDVWIECFNIDNLGWIRGRRDATDKLCFEFPGFKFTDFYSEEEAFSKINQVLSRKIYIPKTLQPKWHVVEKEDKLKTKFMIKPELFGSDFVLTRRGPCHKKDLIKSSKKKVVEKNNFFHTLEERSQSLEKEGEKLLQEFKEKGESLRKLYNIHNDQREHISECLQNILNRDSPESLNICKEDS